MPDSIRRTLLIFLLSCTAALPLVLGLLVAVAKPQAPTPVDYSAATVGGLRYVATTDRPIHASDAVDARIVKGLPAGERRAGRENLLLGVFVTVANDSRRPRPSAARIDLRDEAMHVYRPLRLPAANRYAYRPGMLAPGARVPRNGTPAADNLAAGGRLLLYRVPAWRYRSGALELVVHDPLHAGAVRTVVL